jgi:hypothetical protein
MKYRTSPDRYSFHEKCDKQNLDSGKISQETYNQWQKFWADGKIRDSIPPVDLPDLEYELRTSDYIHNKCVASDEYCRNLYAALCNNDFIKDGKTCGYSWRYAGGIIANILEKGDYIDWYCSGWEGYITDEVRKDITKLGWEISLLDY